MNTYEEVEYTNVTLELNQKSVHWLIERLVKAGFPVNWKETQHVFHISIQTMRTSHELVFDKEAKAYNLSNQSYHIKDQRLSELLQKFIYEVKGHAILKKTSGGQLVIHNIRYGEPIRIVEFSGDDKKVLFEKECSVSIYEVIEAFKRTDAEKRIPVLIKDIDNHLSLLHRAMEDQNEAMIARLKEDLEKKRIEMLRLEI